MFMAYFGSCSSDALTWGPTGWTEGSAYGNVYSYVPDWCSDNVLSNIFVYSCVPQHDHCLNGCLAVFLKYTYQSNYVARQL